MRFTFNKDHYKKSLSIHPDYKNWTDGDVDIITYTTPRGTPAAMVFVGKAMKPTFHKGYLSVASRDASIANTIANHASRKAATIARRAARSAPHSLKVGDILCSSWGYDQTNYDFYQVVKLVGKNSVAVRPVTEVVVSDHISTRDVVPVKDSFRTPFHGCHDFKDGVAIKRVNPSGNYIKFSSYEYAYPWDGKPKNETAPGWGH